MAFAILRNNKSTAELRAANSVIEQYKAEVNTINASTFVDFVNKSTCSVSPHYQLYSGTYAGCVESVGVDQNRNKDWTNYTEDYYYLNYGMRTFKNTIFQLDDETVLWFYAFQNDNSTHTTHVCMFTIKDNTITLNQGAQLSVGGNLDAIQMTDSRYLVAHGSARGCTTTYYLYMQTLDVDVKNKKFVLNAAASTSRYYYISLAGLYKITDNTAIYFSSDGNGGGYFYSQCRAMSIAPDGTISFGNHVLTQLVHSAERAQYYDIHQLSPTKYIEVGLYNAPFVNVVTVDGITSTRKNLVNLPTSQNQTGRIYIYKSFRNGDCIYVPYYNGSTWVLGIVDCSKDVPAVAGTVALATGGTTYPIIQQLDDNHLLALQFNGNLAYATYFKLKGNAVQASNCVLTVNDRVSAIRKFVRTGDRQGYLVCMTLTQNYGMVVCPIVWTDTSISCGEAQVWNDSYFYSPDYTFFTNVGDGYSICLYQPYQYSYYNSLNCFSIYQKGTELRRGDHEVIYKNNQYPTTTQRMLCDFTVDPEKKRVSVLFRNFINGNTSYYNLYFTTIGIRGNRTYVATPLQIRTDTDTSERTFNYARLIEMPNDKFMAMYNHARDILGACSIDLNWDMRVTPAENTGHIGGFTQTSCSDIAVGNIVMLNND